MFVAVISDSHNRLSHLYAVVNNFLNLFHFCCRSNLFILPYLQASVNNFFIFVSLSFATALLEYHSFSFLSTVFYSFLKIPDFFFKKSGFQKSDYNTNLDVFKKQLPSLHFICCFPAGLPPGKLLPRTLQINAFRDSACLYCYKASFCQFPLLP